MNGETMLKILYEIWAAEHNVQIIITKKEKKDAER